MKRVLMTNFFFAKYTGSELHVLEMARLFEKRGFEVTIAVFEKAYPLLAKAGAIRVVDVLNEELENFDYDIVFVQHYPVLDFLCCKYDITYKKLIVSKLSVISDLEHLPVCTSEADCVLCVSEECADEVCKIIGKSPKVRVFKNSVSDEFFNSYENKVSHYELKKIAVISNHVPEEVQELADILEGQCSVEYIGIQYSPKLVDVKLLKQYDLIITIGRTVQQCFALGVPVYVYDYFGGPGYITDENFGEAEKNNFSGRGEFGTRTALELKTDIVTNYKNNLLYLEKLHLIAKKEYHYDLNFEQIYQELLPEESWSSKKMDFYAGAEKQRIAMYSKAAPRYALEESIKSQLYFDYGDGFSEVNSIKWNSSQICEIEREIELNRRVEKLRFDPCDVPAECKILEVYINGKRKEEYSGTKESFFDFDPQFIIELSEEEQALENLNVKLVYSFKRFEWEKMSSVYGREYEKVKYQLSVSEARVKELEETIVAVKEYYKMTPKNIIKRVLNVFKR